MEKSSTSRLSAWIEPHPRLGGLSLIDHLFNRLDGLYPHKFRSALGGERSVENWREAWADGFAEEGVTMAEIKRGLAACRKKFAWPPSFAEFLAACRPPVDFEAAFYDAVRQLRARETGRDRWTSPCVYWAAVAVGGFDMRNSSWEKIKTRWTAALQAEIDKGEWPDVPEYAPALPAPGKSSVTAEEGLRRIAALRDALTKKMTMPETGERQSNKSPEYRG